MLRGAAFWPVVRLFSMVFTSSVPSLIPGASTPGPLAPHLITIPLMTAGLAWIDLYRRDEVLFFANLGVGLRTLVAMYVLPAVVLEGIVMLLQ